MLSNLKIVLGSTSEHKIRALQQALANLGCKSIQFEWVSAPSGQAEQPCSLFETAAGAYARALYAGRQCPESDIAIGIESGILLFPDPKTKATCSFSLDLAVVALIRSDGYVDYTTSTGILFPDSYTQKANIKGFDKHTVGAEIAEDLGGDPTDPHSTLTKGRITRESTLVPAIEAIFKRNLFNGHSHS